MDQRAEGEAVSPGRGHVGDLDPGIARGRALAPKLKGLGTLDHHDVVAVAVTAVVVVVDVVAIVAVQSHDIDISRPTLTCGVSLSY